jgi:hypothetical protein
MKIQSPQFTGSFRVSTLDTDLTPPTSSGTTKMVIVDQNGDFSFTDLKSNNAITYTFGGTGTPTVSATIPYLRVQQNVSCSNASLITSTAPSDNFRISVKKSIDSGSTFPTTITTLTVASGSKVATTTPTSSLSIGDFISVDIISVNGASDWTLQLLTFTV